MTAEMIKPRVARHLRRQADRLPPRDRARARSAAVAPAQAAVSVTAVADQWRQLDFSAVTGGSLDWLS